MLQTFKSQVSGQAENRFYGHVHILAKYCGLEGEPFLNGYLQHGWNATDGFGNYLGRKRFANKFVWSKRCENLIKSYKKNVFAIGAPWLYLEDTYPLQKPNSKKGVVAYPSHSSNWSKMADTHEENSEYLKKNFGQVTVVLHKYDFSFQDVRSKYEKQGHTTYCHGNGTPWEKDFDINFLKNQRDFLSQFETVVANVMQTAVLYATSLGLEPFIGGPLKYNADKNDVASQIGDGSINWDEELNKNKKSLWQQELGLESKKSKLELREILGWNSNRVSYFFIKNRAKDLVLGSSLITSFKVFQSNFKKI
jgi:hypothetical protein